jgi:cysteine desulfurase
VRVQRKQQGNSLPLYLHSDACQAPLYLDCAVAKLGVDLLTLNGGKMYGPKQSGMLYVRSGVALEPLIDGGGQEFGVRSGTENVAFAVGFATALELAQKGRQERVRQMTQLRDYCIGRLASECGAELSGHPTKRVANNVHVTFAGKDNERIIFALDDCGIAVASGSACSASSDEPSTVLRAIGFSDEKARSSIRLSFGKSTTKESIDMLIENLKNALNA